MHERLKSTNNSKKTITTIKTKIVEKITFGTQLKNEE